MAGAPFFKNYAGVPLRTRKGINIGSIFVIDSRIRPALSATERSFLGVVADNVVKHLEMLKDKKDYERGLTMSACISTYVDPLQRSARPTTRRHVRTRPSFLAPSQADSVDVDEEKDEGGRLTTYRRGAELLLKGLDLDEGGGGVMFLDTLPVGIKYSSGVEENANTSTSQDESDEDIQVSIDPSNIRHKNQDPSHGAIRPKEVFEINATELLAHATQPDHHSRNQDSVARGIEVLSPRYITKLIKRFPDGKLFTFHSDGHTMTSSSDETSKEPSPSRRSKTHAKNIRRHETDELRRCFPSARQVMFLPIWDASTSRWAVCIAYHNSHFRHLSYKSEFVYFATFGNAIIAELTKLASLQANQQKSDFIASISHELRSPLHGVLASCEFLEDTELSTFQQSMVNTATVCSRTLLDTINMVLDYSNINRFEKMKEKGRKPRRDLSANSRSKTLQTSLSTQRTVDIAGLLEEVVDSVSAGHAFEHRLKSSSSLPSLNTAPKLYLQREIPVEGSDFKLILDIGAQNWSYFSEPGALRRIIMNLVDNAIKFTKEGYVHVKLQSNNPKDSTALGAITLTVSDSGQGISPAYLKDTVFTPFSQESNLTSGSGLGLSLVKSIVRNMGGRISIDSIVGEGTSVIVKLPMVREPTNAHTRKDKSEPEQFDNAAECNRSASIIAVKGQVFGKTAALNWHLNVDNLPPNQSKALRLLQASLVTYLSRWFGLSVSPWQKGRTYDIVISTLDGFEVLKQSAPEAFTSGCQHVVVRTVATPSPTTAETFASQRIGVLNCPFGPTRLSQVLQDCLGNMVPDKGNASEALPLHEKGISGLPSDSTESLPAVEAATALTNSIISETGEKSSESKEILTTCIDDAKVSILVTSGPLDLNPPQTSNNPLRSSPPIEDSQISHETVHVESDYSSSAVPLPKPPPDGPTVTVTLSGSISIDPTPQEPAHTTPTIANPPSISNTPSPTPSILLVEDNPINLRLLQVHAKKLAYTTIHTSTNGLLATQSYTSLLHSTPSAPPRLIFMDLSMPVMDGFEATRRIRRSEAEYAKLVVHRGTAPPRAFIVALTGLSSLKDQKEAFAAGVDRFVMKPVQFKELKGLVGEWRGGGEG